MWKSVPTTMPSKNVASAVPSMSPTSLKELTPELPVKDDRAVEREARHKDDADCRGYDERGHHHADQKVGEREEDDGTEIRRPRRKPEKNADFSVSCFA